MGNDNLCAETLDCTCPACTHAFDPEAADMADGGCKLTLDCRCQECLYAMNDKDAKDEWTDKRR